MILLMFSIPLPAAFEDGCGPNIAVESSKDYRTLFYRLANGSLQIVDANITDKMYRVIALWRHSHYGFAVTAYPGYGGPTGRQPAFPKHLRGFYQDDYGMIDLATYEIAPFYQNFFGIGSVVLNTAIPIVRDRIYVTDTVDPDYLTTAYAIAYSPHNAVYCKEFVRDLNLDKATLKEQLLTAKGLPPVLVHSKDTYRAYFAIVFALATLREHRFEQESSMIANYLVDVVFP